MVVLHHLNNEQYLKIIDYLYRKCDRVAFALPNFEASHYSKTSTRSDTVIVNQLAPNEINKENKSFQDYKNKVSPLLEELKECIREVYTASNYFGELRAYDVETYILTLNETVLNVLKRYGNVSVWRYPDLPEDLLFYNRGMIIARAASREDKMTIYEKNIEGYTKGIFDLLEDLNVSYSYYEKPFRRFCD